jgi:hypothetical protein
MAYTKYSLTPANNTATPPDGAPEGMLPSAVNDTMRDMMAQIRDCGDGIRDGTYTMTAPKITGGTITGVAFTGNTFTSPVISGGTINNATIGATTATTGKFTTLEATGVATFSAGAVGTPAITTTGDTNTGIFFPAADTIAFTEGGAEAMRIDSSGNILVNTTSTGADGINISVIKNISFAEGSGVSYANMFRQSSSAALVLAMGYKYTATASGFASSVGTSIAKSAISLGTVAGGITFYADAAVTTANGTDVTPTERMRITSGGEVYIAGTTDQGAYNLQCNGTGVWGAGAYVNGSDERIKDDIEPLESGLDVVAKLNPVTYKYKKDWSKDQSTQTGFIAQELLTALEGKNYVDGVVQQGGEYMSVAYQNIIPILTKAIQELKDELDATKAEVALLKSK